MPQKKQRETWKKAITDLLAFHSHDISFEKFGLPFVKRTIPFVSKIDPIWLKFDKELFDTNEYKAHQALYDTIKEGFNKLMSDHEA